VSPDFLPAQLTSPQTSQRLYLAHVNKATPAPDFSPVTHAPKNQLRPYVLANRAAPAPIFPSMSADAPVRDDIRRPYLLPVEMADHFSRCVEWFNNNVDHPKFVSLH
jgi:hypothetical protein